MSLISFILLLVGCIMITLTIQELVPKSLSYNMKKYSMMGFILGLLISILSILFF